MTLLGRVGQVWVFPVKSMTGSLLDAVDLDAGGLVGDRAWGVVDPEGATVTAAHEPRLRAVAARLVGGSLHLDVPDAPGGLAGEEADEALSSWLGRQVRLERRDGAGFVDVAPVHLVSARSMADAEHAESCDACDVTAPRANLVLDLEPGAPGERDWVGTTVTVGGAALDVVRLPGHCLGVYAEVPRPGMVSVGDEVRG